MISCSSKDIHFKDMCCKREQGLHVQNMIASLDSRVNLIVEEGGGGGSPVWTLNVYEKLHFDNEQAIHTSSENHEESGHTVNSDPLITSF